MYCASVVCYRGLIDCLSVCSLFDRLVDIAVDRHTDIDIDIHISIDRLLEELFVCVSRVFVACALVRSFWFFCGYAGHLREAFSNIDADNNGSICVDELKMVLKSEGENVNSSTAAAAVHRVCKAPPLGTTSIRTVVYYSRVELTHVTYFLATNIWRCAEL